MTALWYSYRTFNLKKHLWDIRSVISYKFWYDWSITESWRLAQKQYNYFKNPVNGYINGVTITITKPSAINYVARKCGVRKGDLLYFAGKKGDSVHHATMISKVKDGKIYYTAHTKARWDYDLKKSMEAEQVIIVKIRDNAS